jgi:hypothetical protein
VTRIPPLKVRRLTVTPLVLGLEVLFIAASPVLFAIAAALSPVFGGRRPLRVLTIVLTYAVGHVAAVASYALLWASGRGGEHGPHYAVMRWFVGGIARAALRVARVKVTMHGSEAAEAALAARERPLVVLSIHSGEASTRGRATRCSCSTICCGATGGGRGSSCISCSRWTR